jgi:methionyl aminopeptidase
MQLIIYYGCAEPMLIMGSRRDVMWNDNWTVVIADGGLSPQFEHSLLITKSGVEILIV